MSALNNDYPKYDKTDEENTNIKKILKTFYLTANLEDQELEKIAGAMKIERFKNEENIIKYGDSGRIFYILAKGSVNVHIYEDGTSPDDPDIEAKRKILKPMQEGVYFGELALLYNDKRSASIFATSDVETFTLDGNIFKMIIVKASMNKRNIQLGFLEGIKLFASLNKFQKLKLVDGLAKVEVKQGEMVIKEGDQGEEFYIIEQGELDCLKLHEYKGKKGFVFVRTLQSGQHFGELALLNNMARSLSIRAKTACRLLKLDREAFTRILGSIEGHLAKDYGNEF